MHSRSRPFLVFERLLSGSRVSCRDAGNTALCSLVNPTGPSTTRWQFSADNHLSRSFDHLLGAGEQLVWIITAPRDRFDAISGLQAWSAQARRVASNGLEHPSSVQPRRYSFD
jgi:hypothetical protein